MYIKALIADGRWPHKPSLVTHLPYCLGRQYDECFSQKDERWGEPPAPHLLACETFQRCSSYSGNIFLHRQVGWRREREGVHNKHKRQAL